jgi:argininosuccinate lyase
MSCPYKTKNDTMKLWEKEYLLINKSNNSRLETTENGFSMAKYDALGSIAHAKMLGQIGLLTTAEESLVAALEEIIVDVEKEIS